MDADENDWLGPYEYDLKQGKQKASRRGAETAELFDFSLRLRASA